MVKVVSGVKLLSAPNSPQHTNREHKGEAWGGPKRGLNPLNLAWRSLAPFPIRENLSGPGGFKEIGQPPRGKRGFGYLGGSSRFPLLTESPGPRGVFGGRGRGVFPFPSKGGDKSRFFPPKNLGGKKPRGKKKTFV
eukprot:FR743147.1.p3 GENE.FR743147.1~~FR743147.1.p3  ORF type:complete len:136 (+),score=43.86 FR743147.1:752-1159(+)